MTEPAANRQGVPAGASALAMWLFLLSLAVLFAASMLAYIMIRYFSGQDVKPYAGQTYPLPHILWLSTAIVLSASLTISRAVASVKRQRIGQMKVWLWVTFSLAIAFCAVQAPAMLQLFREASAGDAGRRLLAFIAVLIFIHAAHVIGGVVYLIVVLVRAYSGMYDHEHYIGVKHAALYWHFLDIVWLVMYGMLLIAG